MSCLNLPIYLQAKNTPHPAESFVNIRKTFIVSLFTVIIETVVFFVLKKL